jgi:hypothetical protein
MGGMSERESGVPLLLLSADHFTSMSQGGKREREKERERKRKREREREQREMLKKREW